MILADKIISLRKKSGWSQEELARELGVSRQAISKWEGAQSVPDISRILEMSEVFGVSTDFLLKDELDMSDITAQPGATGDGAAASTNSSGAPTLTSTVGSGVSLRHVCLEEATEFLNLKQRTSRLAGLGAFAIILGAVLMTLFAGLLPETPNPPLTKAVGAAIGMGCLFVLMGLGISLLVYMGYLEKPFEDWKKLPLETAYGVDGMVRARREDMRPGYLLKMIGGGVLMALGVPTMVIGAIIDDALTQGSGNSLVAALFIPLGMVIIGTGASLLISGGVMTEAVNILLQEGQYRQDLKRAYQVIVPVSTAYWLVVAAVFLGYGFVTQNWGISWVILPVGALLYAALVTMLLMILTRKRP